LKAGVLTLFGGAELTGSWAAHREEAPTAPRSFDLEVFARQLWINQFVLDGNVTHMTVSEGTIAFSPIIGSGQQLSGSLGYRDYPELDVHNFRFVDDGREKLLLDGKVGAPHWDFRLTARDIDASIVRGLLDTTVPMSGPMEMHLTGTGSLR